MLVNSAYPPESRSADAFLAEVKAGMDRTTTMHHAFLSRFRDERLSTEELKTFGVLWYKVARMHKKAFPAVILNVTDDDVRFDLIEILREEYGNGDKRRIHARLLLRFLSALGLDEGDVDRATTPREVGRFGEEVLTIWKDGPEGRAFGLHFGLEYLASALHGYFADGLAKYEFLSRETREYFEYHRVAEVEHADHSEAGFRFYAAGAARRELLCGVEDAVELLEGLWSAFDRYVFGTDRGHQGSGHGLDPVSWTG